MGRLLAVGVIAGGAWYGYSLLSSDAVDGAPTSRSAGAPTESPRGARQPTVQFIARVDRAWDGDGEVFRVRPTRRGRLVGPDDLRTAWRQAVAAGVPDRQGLRHQFYCHPLSIIARGKPTWDLEVWRPAVGLSRTMLSACNPR